NSYSAVLVRHRALSLPVARRFVSALRATAKSDKQNNWWIIRGKNKGFNSENHEKSGKIARR
ncbi:MAG: hypothetical protein PUJ71_01635, partial [Clostridiales bacterium]|nr:hypothetical protein [Clostridiales bacterium]